MAACGDALVGDDAGPQWSGCLARYDTGPINGLERLIHHNIAIGYTPTGHISTLLYYPQIQPNSSVFCNEPRDQIVSS